MKKILLSICAAGAMVLALSGCSTSNKAGNLMLDNNNLTPQQQLCKQLKRKIIFNQSDMNVDTQMHTPTQKARLMQQYRENNCDKM